MDRWYIFDIFHPVSENFPHSLWGAVMWFSYVPRAWEAGIASQFLSHWKWLLLHYFNAIVIPSFKQ